MLIVCDAREGTVGEGETVGEKGRGEEGGSALALVAGGCLSWLCEGGNRNVPLCES